MSSVTVAAAPWKASLEEERCVSPKSMSVLSHETSSWTTSIGWWTQELEGQTAPPILYPDIPSSIALLQSSTLQDEELAPQELICGQGSLREARAFGRIIPNIDTTFACQSGSHQAVCQASESSEIFMPIKKLLPKLSESKMKAGAFGGPQVKRFISCDIFPEMLSEGGAWTSLVSVVSDFLGNHKATR